MEPRSPTYEELVALVRELRECVAVLERENADLRRQLRELRDETPPPAPPPFVKASLAPGRKHRKPGRPQGHPPALRPPPPEIHQEIVVPLPQDGDSGECRCPRCRGELKDLKGHERVVEDIVPATVRVTRYRTASGYCAHCNRRVESRAPEQPPAADLPHAWPSYLLRAHRWRTRSAFICYKFGLRTKLSSQGDAMHQAFLTILVCLATASTSAAAPPAPGKAPARSGAVSPAPVAPAEPPVVRVFRFRAAETEKMHRTWAVRAAMDQKVRADLIRIIDDHLRRVEEAIPRGEAARDWSEDDASLQEQKLGDAFNEDLARWMEQHPAAGAAVQRQASIGEAYALALTADPSAIVRAARAAGLPPAREAEAKELAAALRQRLQAWQDGTDQRLKAARGAGAPGADADLLETLSGHEVQLQIVAAAREARDAVERMLPGEAASEALNVAMLRFLATHDPDAEVAGEGDKIPKVK